MANAFFDQCKESLWKGEIDTDTDTFKVHLYDTGAGAISTSTDSYESDVPDGTATTGILSTLTMTVTVSAAGVFDSSAASDTFSTVTGDQAEALIPWMDTTVDTTSPLLCYIDTTSDASLPVTPNGLDIVVTWNASGIMSW